MFESYAQNAEDVRLNRCFNNQRRGFFIDVGASEPTKHSVTYALYLQGWSGIAIEPLPDRYNELNQIRPRDINLNIALGSTPGEADFYRSLGRGGTSTIVAEIGEPMRASSSEVSISTIKIDTLNEICRKFAPDMSEYQLLKIDVEGAEEMVLRGADLYQYRPLIIIVEGSFLTPTWDEMILQQGYNYIVHDGVNRWYCCKSRGDYAEILLPPINAHDNFRRYDHIGSPFSNGAHPEHRWASGLAQRLVCALGAIGNDVIVAAYTDRIAEHLLSGPCDSKVYRGAVRAVLGRQPSNDQWNWFEMQDRKATINEVYRMLVDSEEFRMKRGKVIASM